MTMTSKIHMLRKLFSITSVIREPLLSKHFIGMWCAALP